MLLQIHCVKQVFVISIHYLNTNAQTWSLLFLRFLRWKWKPKSQLERGVLNCVSNKCFYKKKHIQWNVWIQVFKCYSIPFPLSTVTTCFLILLALHIPNTLDKTLQGHICYHAVTLRSCCSWTSTRIWDFGPHARTVHVNWRVWFVAIINFLCTNYKQKSGVIQACRMSHHNGLNLKEFKYVAKKNAKSIFYLLYECDFRSRLSNLLRCSLKILKVFMAIFWNEKKKKNSAVWKTVKQLPRGLYASELPLL